MFRNPVRRNYFFGIFGAGFFVKIFSPGDLFSGQILPVFTPSKRDKNKHK
jgi:hypothetical protein